MTMVRKRREDYSENGAMLTLAGKTAKRMVTDERRKMEDEELKLEKRMKAMAYAEGKAIAGSKRRKQRAEYERQKARDKLMEVLSRRHAEEKASLKIQAAYRGR